MGLLVGQVGQVGLTAALVYDVIIESWSSLSERVLMSDTHPFTLFQIYTS